MLDPVCYIQWSVALSKGFCVIKRRYIFDPKSAELLCHHIIKGIREKEEVKEDEEVMAETEKHVEIKNCFSGNWIFTWISKKAENSETLIK